MPTLWFSYSTLKGIDAPEPLNSPYTIAWHVGRLLRERAHARGWEFRYVNLDDTTPQAFSNDDVVIGHLWDAPGSFMQQALASSAKAKIILQPYSHGMVSEGDIPRYIELFQKADALLFVTGRYWYDTMNQTPWGVLLPKVTRLDMAVNTELHVYRKTTWNAPGKRGFLAIGADIPAKGLINIAELARVSGIRLGYFGNANADTFKHVPQITVYPGTDFGEPQITRICEDYDFFLSLANMDACPTTLLETSAWGLIALCNKESGYWQGEPFWSLCSHDLIANWEKLDSLQTMPEYELRKRSEAMRQTVIQEYNWAKFCESVWGVVERWL